MHPVQPSEADFDAPDGKSARSTILEEQGNVVFLQAIGGVSSKRGISCGGRYYYTQSYIRRNVTQGRPLVSLVSHLAFWKRREAEKRSEPERIIPLPNLTPPSLEASSATSVEMVDKAREALKVLKLERQIIGTAVTTIYESHSKGVISQAERDQMLERYKVDLKRLEKDIDENQRVVDLHDLELEREQVVKSFNAKLGEIDARLRSLKSGSPSQKQVKAASDTEKGDHAQTNAGQGSVNDPPPVASDSEKRIEQIREEILKAMDRLEQIETEG